MKATQQDPGGTARIINVGLTPVTVSSDDFINGLQAGILALHLFSQTNNQTFNEREVCKVLTELMRSPQSEQYQCGSVVAFVAGIARGRDAKH